MRLFCFLILYSVVDLLQGQHSGVFHYIENKGQWPDKVMYGSTFDGGKIFLENDLLTYHLMDLGAINDAHSNGAQFKSQDVRTKGHVYKVAFIGCNSEVPAEAAGKQDTYYNYFLGNDPNHWAGGCKAYERITRKNLYSGIDFTLYSQDNFLKYDFIIHPNADARNIAMQYQGMEKIEIENGRLKVSTSVCINWEQQPIAYQMVNGKKMIVACNYHLNENILSFDLPNGYNKKYELVIDPQLIFSTYSGSTSDNFGYTATYDEDGYLYSGSSAFGQLYPVTLGAYQTTHQGGNSSIEDGIDMALSKYDTTGTFMVWSTFLGGSGDDLPHSIIVNSSNELMVYGSSGSANFPCTDNAYDSTFNGGTLVSPSGTGAIFPNGTDVVIAHFNQACTQLIGATYLGGSGNDGVCNSTGLKRNYADEFRGEIELDADENIVIISSTFSSDFPMANAFQNTIGGLQDAIVAKLPSDLSTILWSTFLGGNLDDSGFSGAFNSNGNLYVCGGTLSANFPTTPNIIQSTFAGNNLPDGYIFKFSIDGQNVEAATYWGKDEYDQLYFIEIDNEDKVYVYGQTNADNTEMIVNANYGTPNSGNLLSKFSPDLNEVIWSTVFGTGSGKPTLSPSAFLVDCASRVYISGWGSTIGALNPGSNLSSMVQMDITSNAFDSTTTGNDFYLAVFDENMSALQFATFYGGNASPEHVDGGTSRFDKNGIIYQSVCAGCSGNSDFPILPSNAWSATNNATNGCNNAVFKFDYELPLTIADFNASTIGCVNQPFQFTNNSSVAENYHWSFGDGGESVEQNPSHLFANEGDYLVTLTATDIGCGSDDIVGKTVHIVFSSAEILDQAVVCLGDSILLGSLPPPDNYQYQWTPSNYLSDTTVANPIFAAGMSTAYLALVQHDECIDTLKQFVEVPILNLELPADTVVCDDISLLLQANYQPANSNITWSDLPDFSSMLNDNLQDADIEVNVIIPTTYYAEIEVSGCKISKEIFVNLVSFQTIIEGPINACIDDTITLNILDPNPEFNYQWTPDEIIISGQSTPSIAAIVTNETEFTVASITPFNCTAFDQITVDVSEIVLTDVNATADPQYIVQGETSQLQALPSGYIYEWTPPQWLDNAGYQSPVTQPMETITYTVVVIDNDCRIEKEITVYVIDFVCGPPTIFVPNAFTPNKDNNNEKLFVRANNLSELYFVIYNRWGQKMFETTALEYGWDATFEGRELDPDVYVYYLEATCKGGQQYFEEGNITLIR